MHTIAIIVSKFECNKYFQYPKFKKMTNPVIGDKVKHCINNEIVQGSVTMIVTDLAAHSCTCDWWNNGEHHSHEFKNDALKSLKEIEEEDKKKYAGLNKAMTTAVPYR